MPTRTRPWPTGVPCWVDLTVTDVPAAQEFYSAVLGWTFAADTTDSGYVIGQVDGRAAAGIGPIPQAGVPAAWTLYLAADDADGTATAVTDAGGTMLLPPGDVGPLGRMFVAADPTGAVFGVWQQTGMIGSELQDEPGAFVWDDAQLRDVEAGKRFYADVFGFRYAPLGPEAGDGPPDYETFTVPGDDRVAGGIGGLEGTPPGTPSHWLAYFMVADTDAAVQAVGDRGGTVLMAPESTPFGRIAVVVDPFGAPFGLHSAPTGE